jgi:SAM-dependent methyltransferase
MTDVNVEAPSTLKESGNADPADDVRVSALTAGLLLTAFVLFFALLSPIYYLNRWHFKRKKAQQPGYRSLLVQLQDRFPILYEVAMLVQNFPVPHRVYRLLPPLTGDVLQVGCGTGLLNKYLRGRSDIRFTNMDVNPRALRWGVWLKRYSAYVQASIDTKAPFPDCSFDTIVFARCFHHVRYHKRAFQECARLLRDNGSVIILDPVVLESAKGGSNGYMANSSIDGMIWRFTRASIEKHLHRVIPAALSVQSLQFERQPHITNYNLFVPQTDAVVVLTKRSEHLAQ